MEEPPTSTAFGLLLLLELGPSLAGTYVVKVLL
jgi:hypothetical protein